MLYKKFLADDQRGFGGMSPRKRKEVAKKGGEARAKQMRESDGGEDGDRRTND
jgi:hypothetical protein